MRVFCLSITVFLLILGLTFIAVAQPGPAPAAQAKIGLINTAVFYDTTVGITRLVAAYKSLQAEFAKQTTDLNNGSARLQALAKEVETLREQARTGKLPDANILTAKEDEGARLQRELEYKQKDLETAVNKRESQTIGPIKKDIGQAVDQFARQRGLNLVLDIAKMEEAGIIVAFIDVKVDITKEFIQFYNTRPATPAATTPAKPATTPGKP